ETVETATATDGSPLAVVSNTAAYGPDLTEELAAAGANATVVLTGAFTVTGASALQDGQTCSAAPRLPCVRPPARP
ncbi:MAG TPA: hypothetical protein VFO41_05730, partial [Alphaproteobacteria bacterium]|nr:hypothetical protein [Alphaproteobacteria bacterium]